MVNKAIFRGDDLRKNAFFQLMEPSWGSQGHAAQQQDVYQLPLPMYLVILCYPQQPSSGEESVTALFDGT